MELEDHSESEEEILVYAEFNVNEGVDIDQYRSIHVLGIDGKNPIIQADDSFFTGKFASPLGTYMFFEDDPQPQSVDPLFDKLPEKNLKYLCKTNKLLNMEHAYVMPLTNKDPVVKTELDESSDKSLRLVKFTSVESALTKFKEALEVPVASTASTAATAENEPQESSMKKSLEEVLKELNKDRVKIKDKDRKRNNVILYSVLGEFLKIMQKHNKLFRSMKPELEYLGSYFDGLRVGQPTEFDLNLILKLPINYEKIYLDASNSAYDCTNIFMHSEFRRLSKTPATVENGYDETHMWCDKEFRLSVLKFRSWMQKVVDVAMATLPEVDNRRLLCVKNNRYYLATKMSGPANTITIITGSDDNSLIDVDLVPTFSFELEKKPYRSKNIISFSEKLLVYIVYRRT
ncbi:mab-21 protein domain-containing protein [Phthorimaea operculella]|nr:mab-21 protein domain-containing protein [Phthorimaea operculella]